MAFFVWFIRNLTAAERVTRLIANLSSQKEKDQLKSWSFLERVTRLELATSTLARWRSTG